MLRETHKIVVLLLSLAVIFVLLGWIISFNLTLQDTSEFDEVKVKPHSTTIIFEAEKEVESTKTVLVTDRFVGKLDKDANVIAISSNGDAYAVQSGVLLADDMVISSSEEAYSIQRLDEPSKSVSSE
jgi:hypothetical protein